MIKMCIRDRVLEQYLIKRDKLPLHNMGNPNSPFLISLDGSSLTGVSARHWFYKILEASDIDLSLIHI